jgi:HAE1 family hydrophobic/amphiphilic exporter-1
LSDERDDSDRGPSIDPDGAGAGATEPSDPGAARDGGSSGSPSPAVTRASFSTTRPVAIAMVFLAAVVFGYFSYGRLPVTLMPEMAYPTLTVRTEYDGAAPEEVENDISRPIEEALGVIGGLRRLSSISRADLSDVVLEFSWDTPMSEAIQDTLEKLDLVLLPDAAERPLILRFDPSLDPVLELSLSGEGEKFQGEQGLRRLRRIADLQIKRALEPIRGVAAVRVRGGLEEEIHVLLDEEALRRSDLSIQKVIERLGQENINVAGGTIKEGRTEYMVRTLNEYSNLEQIADTTVVRYEGRDVKVRDLGRVVPAHKEREILTRTDSQESVQIDIYKEDDTNIVSLAERVRVALGEFDFEKAKSGELEKEREEQRKKQEARQRGPGAGRPGGPGGPGGAQRKALVERLFEDEGVELRLVADRSVFIENSINEVRNTAIFGGLLAILVLFFFLHDLRTTAIIALSIPISLIVTFAPLNLLGVSLNIMSLGGLALGIGMLVDSSIVVLESIFRCREEGDDLRQAATRGTAEVRGAVIASTLTTIAVFFPMVFVEGVAGQAFGDLGLAVVTSLLASLVVALFLIPMLASRGGVTAGEATGNGPELRHFASWAAFRRDLRAMRKWLWPIGVPYLVARLVVGSLLELVGKLLAAILFGLARVWRRFLGPALGWLFRLLTRYPLIGADRLMQWVGRLYPRGLRWALRHSLAILALVALSLGLTVWIALRLDNELLPEIHQGEFTVEVALPVGTPLEETEEIVGPVERAILEEKESIRSLILTVGYDAATAARSDEGEHTARFKVLLDRADPTTEGEVIDRLRRRFSAIPDLDARVVRPVLFSFRTPIEVEVHGDDLPQLRRQAEAVKSMLARLPELADVETTLRPGAPEVEIVYDRDLLARYDLNIGQVAQLVRDKVKGFEATRYNLKDRRIPIIVRLQMEDRETVENVRGLIVNPGGERPIPLSAVAGVRLAEGPSEIRRVDGRRVALVTANIASGSLGGAVDRVDEVLSGEVDWPTGMTFFITGQNQEWQRSQGSLWLALALSIFLVYVIMGAQFESLLHPLVIIVTIPLAFFGSVLVLSLLGISLSVVVFLGMIMLAGIVVNNAIVLVDYINTLRSRGGEREEAIVAAGSVRLRPILMTTATTVLGLTPMALGLGDGAELRTPMAITVISGLIASTVLTLVVIPVLYSAVDRLKVRLLGRESAGQPAAAEAVSG